MVGGPLGRRPRRQPAGDAEDGPGEGGDGANRSAVGDHDHAQIVRRPADGGERAELALAMLGHDEEGGGRDEAHENHQDRDREYDDHGDPAVRPLVTPVDVELPRDATVDAVDGGPTDRQHADDIGRRSEVGHCEHELVVERGRVLDETDDEQRRPLDIDRVADVGAERRRRSVRQRDLFGRRRVPTVEQAEHRCPKGTVGLLTPEVDPGARSWYPKFAVADGLDRAVTLGQGPHGVGGHRGIGRVHPDHRIGTTEVAVLVELRVGGDRRTRHAGRDDGRQQADGQQLLSPVPTEQTPPPTGDGRRAGFTAARRR